MSASTTGRVMVNLPAEIGNKLKLRAKENYRSVSQETVMLIERGIAAEKAASGQN